MKIPLSAITRHPIFKEIMKELGIFIGEKIIKRLRKKNDS